MPPVGGVNVAVEMALLEHEEIPREGPNFDLYKNKVAPISFPAGTMNGDIQLAALGDAASTINVSL